MLESRTTLPSTCSFLTAHLTFLFTTCGIKSSGKTTGPTYLFQIDIFPAKLYLH